MGAPSASFWAPDTTTRSPGLRPRARSSFASDRADLDRPLLRHQRRLAVGPLRLFGDEREVLTVDPKGGGDRHDEPFAVFQTICARTDCEARMHAVRIAHKPFTRIDCV